jgi:hypothetical protein
LAPGASFQVVLSSAARFLVVLRCDDVVVKELDSMAFSELLLGSLVQNVRAYV